MRVVHSLAPPLPCGTYESRTGASSRSTPDFANGTPRWPPSGSTAGGVLVSPTPPQGGSDNLGLMRRGGTARLRTVRRGLKKGETWVFQAGFAPAPHDGADHSRVKQPNLTRFWKLGKVPSNRSAASGNMDRQDEQEIEDEMLLQRLQTINCNQLIIIELIKINEFQFPH